MNPLFSLIETNLNREVQEPQVPARVWVRQPQILPNILLFLLQYRLAHPRAENCHVVAHLARANRTGNQFLPDGLRVQPRQLADIFPQSDFSAR